MDLKFQFGAKDPIPLKNKINPKIARFSVFIQFLFRQR